MKDVTTPADAVPSEVKAKHPLANRAILIVSNALVQRRRLLQAFAACEAATQIASSAAEAVPMLGQCTFELVVVRMQPSADGDAVIRQAVELRVPVLEIVEPMERASRPEGREFVRVLARRLSPGAVVDAAAAWIADVRSARRRRHEPDGLADLSGLTALVIAATPAVQRMIEALLTVCSAEVVVAATAQRGAEMLLARRPDVIVLDAAVGDVVTEIVVPAQRRRVPMLAVEVTTVHPRVAAATRTFGIRLIGTTDLRVVTDMVLDAVAA